MLSEAIAWITTHPVGVALLLLLLGALVYFALMRLLKLAVIVLLGFLALSAYYAYTGEEPPDGLKKITEDASRKIEDKAKELREKAKDKAKEVKDALGDEINRAAQESLNKALGGGGGDEDEGSDAP
ncbi:MAG: hypothetical protein AAFZ18_16955 [Myxococcota bacterium]